MKRELRKEGAAAEVQRSVSSQLANEEREVTCENSHTTEFGRRRISIQEGKCDFVIATAIGTETDGLLRFHKYF